MDHPNIVKLEGYYEDEESITMIMEHCNDADYLEEKLEEVSVGDSRNTRKLNARPKSGTFQNKSLAPWSTFTSTKLSTLT
jgi:serine/threonine protein kinase